MEKYANLNNHKGANPGATANWLWKGTQPEKCPLPEWLRLARSRWSPEEQTLWLGISTVRRLVEKPETVYWNGRCSYSTAQQFLSWPFICLTEMQGRMSQDAINELSQELCKSQKWTKPKHPHRLRWDDYVVVREYTTAWKWNESHKQ